MSQIDWNELKKLMETEWIKDDIEEYLDGFYFNGKFEENDEQCTFFFNGETGGKVDLIFKDKEIRIQKYNDNKIELFVVTDDNLTINHYIIEKRDKGILCTHLVKKFALSTRFHRTALVDLWENRYIIDNNNLEKMLCEIEMDDVMSSRFVNFIKDLDRDELKKYSNCNSEFSTHMKTYYPWDGGRMTSDVPGAVLAFLTFDGSLNVSRLYDLVDGYDKLYRVYDLYRGIINSRNEEDILSIHLGFLSEDCFDLKSLMGITQKEDELLGESRCSVPSEYIEYLQGVFAEEYGYFGEINSSRDDILNIVTNMPNFEVDEVVFDISDDQKDKSIEEKKNVSEKSIVKRIKKVLKIFKKNK